MLGHMISMGLMASQVTLYSFNKMCDVRSGVERPIWRHPQIFDQTLASWCFQPIRKNICEHGNLPQIRATIKNI